MSSRKRISLHKDMADLEGLARKQGWEVTYTGAGHQEWKAPNGEVVSSASTGTSRSVINTKALLKGQGMLTDTADVRQYERAKRRVEQAYRNAKISMTELDQAMPSSVFFLDRLVTEDGVFDLRCVCGIQKLHPLGFVVHVQSCQEALGLVTDKKEEGEEKKGKGPSLNIPDKCEKGHLLTPENIYKWPDGLRWECRVCRRERQAEARRLKAEAAGLPPAPALVEVEPMLEEAPQPEELDFEMTIPADLNMRELADSVLAAALEAAGRPTEEEVEKRIESAVIQARAEERASAEDLMNEVIAITEERDKLRHEVQALGAKCAGLELKKRSSTSGRQSGRISNALNSS